MILMVSGCFGYLGPCTSSINSIVEVPELRLSNTPTTSRTLAVREIGGKKKESSYPKAPKPYTKSCKMVPDNNTASWRSVVMAHFLKAGLLHKLGIRLVT